MSATFSEIRSLLQRTPHASLWGALCARLDELPEQERDEMALPYIEGHTRRWPAAWCEAPQRWIERALDGEMPPFWELVRHLNLSCHYLDTAQVEALLGSTLLGRVELLNLDSNRAAESIGRTLAHAPALDAVEELRLGYNQLERAAIASLAAARLPSLRRIALDGNPIDSKALTPLLEAPWLAQIEGIELQRCPLKAADLTRLLTRTPRLKAIRLDHIPLGGAILALQALPPGQLTSLELYACAGERAEQIEAFQHALVALISGGQLDGLRALDIGNNAITTETFRALCAAPHIAHLERLLLRRSSFSARATQALTHAAFVRSLRRVEIAHVAEAHAALAAAGLDPNAITITTG
jgi:hypothetical protein